MLECSESAADSVPCPRRDDRQVLEVLHEGAVSPLLGVRRYLDRLGCARRVLLLCRCRLFRFGDHLRRQFRGICLHLSFRPIVGREYTREVRDRLVGGSLFVACPSVNRSLNRISFLLRCPFRCRCCPFECGYGLGLRLFLIAGFLGRDLLRFASELLRNANLLICGLLGGGNYLGLRGCLDIDESLYLSGLLLVDLDLSLNALGHLRRLCRRCLPVKLGQLVELHLHRGVELAAHHLRKLMDLGRVCPLEHDP